MTERGGTSLGGIIERRTSTSKSSSWSRCDSSAGGGAIEALGATWWSACASAREVAGPVLGIGDQRLAEDGLERRRQVGDELRRAAHARADARVA